MLIPSERVSVANTTLTRPAREAALDRLLERRDQAGVVGGEAGLQAGQPGAVTQDGEVGVGEVAGGRLGDWRIWRRSSALVRRRPSRMHWRTASSQPARLKMK